MKISELIEALEAIKAEKGDLMVFVWDAEDGCVPALKAKSETYTWSGAQRVVIE